MTNEELQSELPPGWILLKHKQNGEIEVVNESHNVVVAGKDWQWIKTRMTSISLSARVPNEN